MTSRNRLVATVTVPICAAILVASAWFASAGDLTPPVGPVAPTPGPEPRTAINATNTPGDADSLFKITQRGSYYLTGNITGVAGKHGIEIIVSGVTLDLNGFDLVGVAGMGAFDGVSVSLNNLTNIAVVNGSVRSWGAEGVDLGTFTAINCRVADLLASGNAGVGIYVGSGCTVTNCSASGNIGTGIGATSGCAVTNCTAHDNSGSGISVNSGCTVTNCSSFFNTLDGIFCASSCQIRDNTCSINGNGGSGAGIHALGNDNRIDGNNCASANRGIDVDFAGNIIIRNSCSGNTTNYDIIAGNRYGPIIDITAGGTAAVSGSSAASTVSSTDPWANFSF